MSVLPGNKPADPRPSLTKVEEFWWGSGIFEIGVWRDPWEKGWYYDGPASTGPRNVRRSGRGPNWRGPVTASFAGVLFRKAWDLGGVRVRMLKS